MTNVRRLRVMHGLTRNELAKAASISYNTIRRMEMSQYERQGGISIASACTVARALGVQVDELFPNTILNHTQGRPIQTGIETTATKPIQIIVSCPSCGTQVSSQERTTGSSECCEVKLAS